MGYKIYVFSFTNSYQKYQDFIKRLLYRGKSYKINENEMNTPHKIHINVIGLKATGGN